MKWKNLLIMACLLIFLLDTSFAQVRRRPIPGRRMPRKQMMQQTQQNDMLGVYGGQNLDTEQYFIGAHLWLPAGVFWSLVPGFNYHLDNDETSVSRWQFNGDLIFKPRPRGVLYFGGGLVVDYRVPEEGNSDTEFGGSVLTGLMFGAKRSPLKLFVQGRYTFLDDAGASVMAGMNLVLR